MSAATISYSLTMALDLSPIGCARHTSPGGNVHLRVDTLEGWLIVGELAGYGSICEESEEEEWCRAYLANRGVSLEEGWLPEMPLVIPDDEHWLP